jgi:hypothetical protein
MFAVVHSPQDPLPPSPTGGVVLDAVTPRSNNVTQRNYWVQEASAMPTTLSFLVHNPTSRRARAVLRIVAPPGWKVFFDKFPHDQAFPLAPKERVLVSLEVQIPDGDARRGVGEVKLIQETWTEEEPIVGGIKFRFGKEAVVPAR